MAVKVLEVPAVPPKRCKCKNCGAKLAYADTDVKEYSGTDYGGGPDGQTWIDCPNCSERVILTSW